MNAAAGEFQRELGQLGSRLVALPDKPEETPAATLAALWQLAAGVRMSAVAAQAASLPLLDAAGHARLRELVELRLSGVPLAHITGRQSFMGLELISEPGALIPRRETEILGNALLEKARELSAAGGELLAIDVCTGSGNLAVALASHCPAARVFAADLSTEACALAEGNVRHLGLGDRVQVRPGDLLAPFDTAQFHGRVDLLSCNPPYISTARMATMPVEIVGHEPALAFDGGSLGVRIIQRIITDAPRFLRPGGWLLFEVGLGQGPAVQKRVAKTGKFDEVGVRMDAEGEARVVVARLGGMHG